MILTGENLRLFISQGFTLYFLLMFIPLKAPVKRNVIYILVLATLVTMINALIIINFGINFYIDFYFFTLTIPYILIFLCFAVYKGNPLVFGLLTIQTMGNIGVLNGLLASFVFFGEDNAYVDIIARVLTYLLYTPILFKFIKPNYLKMVKMLKQEWWILNATLLVSYALAYYLLFVPTPVFDRPDFFIHSYLGILLSILVYMIMFIFFIEVKLKKDIEIDKQLLSQQVSYLAKESEKIISIAYIDTLTGVKNRYSLYRNLDQLILTKKHFLVLFIDLDNFKIINDDYDHAKGDCYLKTFVKTLETYIKGYGEVYRFAGDEFVCLVTENTDTFIPNQLRESLEEAFKMDIPFYGFSQGISVYPLHGLNADDLINYADQMMYTEKKAKKIRR